MSARDRWVALAGVLAGVAATLAVVDGVLLWQLSGDLSHDTIMLFVKICIIVTGLSTLASMFVRYRIAGVR